MSEARRVARDAMNKLRQQIDMTPVKMAATMPPEIVAIVDECDSLHSESVDMLVEAARLDIEKSPDITGAIYGYYMTRFSGLMGDPFTMGVLGEAILRLAKLPDLEDETEARFEQIIKGDTGE